MKKIKDNYGNSKMEINRESYSTADTSAKESLEFSFSNNLNFHN